MSRNNAGFFFACIVRSRAFVRKLLKTTFYNWPLQLANSR